MCTLYHMPFRKWKLAGYILIELTAVCLPCNTTHPTNNVSPAFYVYWYFSYFYCVMHMQRMCIAQYVPCPDVSLYVRHKAVFSENG